MRYFLGGLLIISAFLIIAGAAGGYEQSRCTLNEMFLLMAGGGLCGLIGWLCGYERG